MPLARCRLEGWGYSWRVAFVTTPKTKPVLPYSSITIRKQKEKKKKEGEKEEKKKLLGVN